MFIKIDENAIINIEDISSVQKDCDGEYLYINIKNVKECLVIEGEGKTLTDRQKDIKRVYNFIWDSICAYRSKQSDYKGIITYP